MRHYYLTRYWITMMLLHARHVRDALLNYERMYLSSRLELNVTLWEVSVVFSIEVISGSIIDPAKAVTILFDTIMEY